MRLKPGRFRNSASPTLMMLLTFAEPWGEQKPAIAMIRL